MYVNGIITICICIDKPCIGVVIMREIKFRAWDEENNKYWYSSDEACVLKVIDGILGLYEDDNFYNETHIPKYILISNTLEQYTGRCDNNGVDIYVGDSIEWFEAPGMDYGTAHVIFNSSVLSYYIDNYIDDIYTELYNVTGYCNVIGHIHEELL